MNAETRKRLEEAARENALTYKASLQKTAYRSFEAGAEWMLKEAGCEMVFREMRRMIIHQAKEWIRDRNRHACQEWLDKECADFEADMNKLWEGEK